jgi:hypothetical protein
MDGVLAAETAILLELNTIRIVLLVLERVVVSLLAFGASQRDLYPHFVFLLVAQPAKPGACRILRT